MNYFVFHTKQFAQHLSVFLKEHLKGVPAFVRHFFQVNSVLAAHANSWICRPHAVTTAPQGFGPQSQGQLLSWKTSPPHPKPSMIWLCWPSVASLPPIFSSPVSPHTHTRAHILYTRSNRELTTWDSQQTMIYKSNVFAQTTPCFFGSYPTQVTASKEPSRCSQSCITLARLWFRPQLLN